MLNQTLDKKRITLQTSVAMAALFSIIYYTYQFVKIKSEIDHNVDNCKINLEHLGKDNEKSDLRISNLEQRFYKYDLQNAEIITRLNLVQESIKELKKNGE